MSGVSFPAVVNFPRDEVTTVATESIFLLGRGQGSPWVRAHPPAVFPDEGPEEIVPTPPARPRPQQRTSGPRFVEPCRFGPAQRAALLSVLEAEDLGDEDSRQIFLAALEYDLAGCRRLLDEMPAAGEQVQAPRPPESGPENSSQGPAATPTPGATPAPPTLAPPDPASTVFTLATIPPPSDTRPGPEPIPSSSPALFTLAHLAGELAQALAELTPTQRATLLGALENSDCLARGYGNAYLDSMRLELLHLKAAFSTSGLEPGSAAAATSSSTDLDAQVTASCPQLVSAPPPSPPAVPPELRQFLRRAADAYNDCFEGEPRLAAEAPFPHLLRVLASVTGLALQEDEMTLREILASGH